MAGHVGGIVVIFCWNFRLVLSSDLLTFQRWSTLQKTKMSREDLLLEDKFGSEARPSSQGTINWKTRLKKPSQRTGGSRRVTLGSSWPKEVVWESSTGRKTFSSSNKASMLHRKKSRTFTQDVLTSKKSSCTETQLRTSAWLSLSLVKTTSWSWQSATTWAEVTRNCAKTQQWGSWWSKRCSNSARSQDWTLSSRPRTFFSRAVPSWKRKSWRTQWSCKDTKPRPFTNKSSISSTKKENYLLNDCFVSVNYQFHQFIHQINCLFKKISFYQCLKPSVGYSWKGLPL